MSREIMQQVLRIIKLLRTYDDEQATKKLELISAFEQELAKPEQEPFKPDWVNYRQGLADGAAQPQPEPVAQIRVKKGHWIETPRSIKVKSLPDGLHNLYTAPPRKEWVGLKDDDLSETYNDLYTQYTRDDVNIADFILIARTIESTLKEKNT